MEELLTFEETMNYLKVSRTTLNRWLNDGKIKKLKLGEGKKGVIRIRKSEVERFLKEAEAEEL